MQTVLPIFILILFGAVFVNIKLAKSDWVNVLNDYVVRIGFPALILSSLSRLEWDVHLHGKILIVNSIFVLFCFAFALIISHVFRFDPKLKRTLFIALPYGNVAYLGIPLVVSFWGDKFQPEASLITACYLSWIFTAGMMYLEYSKSGELKIKLVLFQLVKNPLILAVVIGLVLTFSGIKLPFLIARPLEMISASVTPVILFSLGIFIGRSQLGRVKEWLPVFLLVIFMLFVKPVVMYLGVKGVFTQVHEFNVSILEAAVPMALTPFALSREFDLDSVFLARGIVISTALSVISLYLWHCFLTA